jgi:glycosyltransferase involved in cell wall biosynthesis
MNKKHILYITYDGLTDFLGQSQVLPYILGLEEKGYRFSILSFEKPEKIDSNKHIIHALIANKNIQWYPHTYHKRFSILATLWDLHIGLRFIRKLYKKDRFDGVHCRSYIPAIMGLLSKKIYRTGFIFDMRGFWADERVDGALWNLKNPVFYLVYKFFKWIEKKCLLHADYVVTLTNNSYEEMKTWKFVTGNIKFKIIPCCADLNIFSRGKLVPDEIKRYAEKIHADGKTVISYLGSIGTWYMVDEMIEFYLQFKEEFNPSVFLFITPEKESDILAVVQQYGLTKEDIRVVRAERKEVPYYLALSNYALFFIKPTYSKKSSSPTKLAEIMAMGVPVVCNGNVGDVETQVTESKAGIVLKTFNTDDYIETSKQLKINLSAYYKKEHALDFVENNFSLKNGVQLYSEIYSELFS